MDANRLVFGRPTPPPAAIPLRAGELTLEFDPTGGAIRYVELPDGTEAVRAVYPSVRRDDWSTLDAMVDDLKVETREDGFDLSFSLAYEIGYGATVRVTGGPEGIVYAYEGTATEGYETNRTGLCVLHPISLADEPLEIRHPDGKRESGRFPDLVQPDWPFREVVGISTKLPGFRVETSMEGETFEMEDQRNFGDASFKTYCYPQNRPYPYRIEAGQKIAQTVRIVAQPWGSRVEGLPPMPDGVAGLLFVDETLPVPLIGLCADATTDPDTFDLAPVDYLRMPAEDAADHGLPLELSLDLSQDAEARVARALQRIASLPQPPDRVVVSPVGARTHVDALRKGMDDVLVLVSGGSIGDLNRSDLKADEADGVAFGFHPQSHLIDDQTLFENVEAIPDLAATAAERTEGPIVVGPVRLGRAPDGRTDSLLFASWLVAAIASAVRSDVDALTLFDLSGEDGLFRDGRPIPAYHVLADLHEFADGELVVGVGTARRAAGFGLVLDESFRAIVANLTPSPLTLSVVAAGDGPHAVKVLDGRNVERAILQPAEWRAEAGETVEPVEGTIEIELGPYGVARIDAEVDDLDDGNN